jgi:DNA-binding XRE family transcriptional regulator
MGEKVMNMSSVDPDEIRSHRELWMMSRETMAEMVGVPVKTVIEWEEGVVPVPDGKVGVVRRVLDIRSGKEGSDGPRIPQSDFGQAALLRQLGRLAKQRREELGLGRVPFAKEAGLGSDKTIVDFEFGRRLMNGTNQRKVEKALGWRLGVIDDVMRMVNRKASEISMEDVDAEDSLHLAAQKGLGLALVSNEDLLEELAKRLGAVPNPFKNKDPKNLYGLAASTNVEHLEDEEGNK